MTKQALIELRDKVASGDLDSTDLGVLHGYHALKRHWTNNLEFNRDQKRQIFLAYNGSLDAAVAFLEAVLPNWRWTVEKTSKNEFTAGLFKGGEGFSVGEADTPARALLLATLEALIERVE